MSPGEVAEMPVGMRDVFTQYAKADIKAQRAASKRKR